MERRWQRRRHSHPSIVRVNSLGKKADCSLAEPPHGLPCEKPIAARVGDLGRDESSSLRNPDTLKAMQRSFPRLISTFLLCGVATLAWAQQTAPLPDAPVSQTLGSISGIVLDPSGAIVQGAHVALTTQTDARAEIYTSSGVDGRYTFTGVAPGSYTITVASAGFAPRATSVTLQPGQDYQEPELALAMGTDSTEVRVVITQRQMAQDEVDLEIKQRVLGFIPNFYVSYDPHPLPLSPKQKFEIALRQVFDPVSFVGTGASAGLEMAQGLFKGYGNGAEGFGKRYGATFADSFVGGMIGGAILPSVLHQDPRYYYKGTGTVRQRVVYALEFSVRCKGDNGKWQPAYSNIVGGLAAGGISNLYYPAADRNGAALTFENAGFGILGNAVGNLFQEFLVKKLTPKVPKYDAGP